MVQNLDKKSKSLADARKTEANLAMMHGDGNSAAGAGRGPKLPTHDSESPDAAITNFLLSMRETIDARGVGAEVEVELRFGRISSTATTKRFEPSVYGNACVVLRDEDMRSNSAKFVPGVKAADYDRFMKKLQQISSQDSYAKHEEHSRVEMYPGSKRVVQEMDPNGRPSQPKYLQVKERLGSIDIFLPHCQYDCRVSISLEFPPSDPSSVVGSAPESERNRQRKSAIGQHVRIDLTEVSGDGSSGEPTYEVELELKPNAVKEWLNMAHEQTWVGANTNAGLLWNTLTRHFMPHASQAYKVNWDVMDPEHAVRNAYLSHFDHANKFPGTMPVGFARCNLPVVRARDREYFVSEKTDGVRYFLVVGPGVVVLVDRSSFAFVAPGLESLVSLLPEGTVLDGEYVFNYTLKRYVFMVFDIIAEGSLPSLSHVRKPFKERILAIQTLLSETKLRARHARHAPGNVLPLFRKRWQSVRHIREVFKAISAHTDNGTGEIVRFYNDGKRHHKTDGVVFCPGTAPYVPFSHHDYFKWKWSDLITIDFFAWIENGQLKLNCSGPGKAIDLDQIVVVDPRDLKKIHATLQNAPNHQAVLEFAFNADVGYWQFKMARPDKDTPNYIRTVLSSLINMAEAISEEELQCRILVGDEWSSQMRAKRKQLFASLLHAGGTS
ncbi:hypothetical protein SPRG_20256 [Saprolegnia parasitica CBS 223.65]|uniref:mRNA 5'-phosphatase n=1 Tax=Saprolegnia parasitica (strain CBS 223.65) TaxID=695850 RepID=A0A067CNI0_SAPPC|nr:hypothetical protein SPRG_20256 [Saprolegnia parasitica CBS 223.65]KDO28096.1 hypothetical protein SPRG_20256 [Saprolegnia parasitica CBS 223.65]|eukprot:XP_012201240.1 hypothetical protein SPRG_20256 [Saprolegnia parasitica CBS 223.65]